MDFLMEMEIFKGAIRCVNSPILTKKRFVPNQHGGGDGAIHDVDILSNAKGLVPDPKSHRCGFEQVPVVNVIQLHVSR